MGGPIVRSGASPEFSKNWESIFGKQGDGASAKVAAASGAAKTKKKASKKKAKKS